MSKTIDSLEECCLANVIPSIPVLADYFGLDNLSNEDNICIILGLYIKMLNIWNIKKDIIEKAFKNNELDKLIHETYNKHGKTGYYQLFCNKNIKIDQTHLKV
jgi:hypothetical protein